MEGLVRLINYSINSSARGFIRWIDILTHHSKGTGFSGFEHALVPLQNLSPGLPQLSDEAGEREDDPTAWNGMLWAAPKKRTTIWKRLRRKFGHEDWGSPLLKPKTNLRICDTCGHHYEAKHLCGNCYERIKKETEMIRKQAEEQFRHGPEDKGIVVMYESESEKGLSPRQNKNIIVEIPAPRPSWFSSNLLQRSTLRINTETKAVTPKAPTPIVSADSKEPSSSSS